MVGSEHYTFFGSFTSRQGIPGVIMSRDNCSMDLEIEIGHVSFILRSTEYHLDDIGAVTTDTLGTGSLRVVCG